MTVTGLHFGHETEWVYRDTREPVGEAVRPCPKCGRYRGIKGEDPCIGHLPGVTAACCGHGKTPPAIVLENGRTLIGWREIRKVFPGAGP